MSTLHFLIGVLQATAWNIFIWYLLSTLRASDPNLWFAAFMLLLAYNAFALCPWLRHTEMWNNLGEE